METGAVELREAEMQILIALEGNNQKMLTFPKLLN